MYKEKEIWLPPPQFVEILRLSSIKSIDKLVEIAKSRVGENMDLILPIQFKASDGFVHVLPGDDLYPEKPNYFESDHDLEKYSDKTLVEIRKLSKNLCRSEQKDMFDVNLVSNIKPKDGHISIEFDSFSKL